MPCKKADKTNAAIGSTTSTISNLFLANDEQNINVTIQTLDEDENIIFSKTVENVPFKRNRATFLSGSLYSAASSSNFSVNEAYLEEIRLTF